MKARNADKIATAVFWLGAVVVLGLLFSLLGYILYQGGRHLDLHFITSSPQILRAGGGVGPQLFNSFYLLFLSMLFTVPLGLGAGIYLGEYARPGVIVQIIRVATETLASTPSIVVGLFGLLIFVSLTGWGYTLLGGSLALTVLNLPVMVRISEQAITSVPVQLREASLALGATRWQTVVRVVLPAAFPGLVTGIILTAGRVFGEAAALLYTAGMSSPPLNWGDLNPSHPASPLNPMRPAGSLAVHVWKINAEGLIPDVRRVADGASALLVLVVLLSNLGARWLGRRIYRRITAG